MELYNKRILITGGAGFIGTKLCMLLKDNNQILLYDSLRRNSIRDTDLLSHENVRLVQGDVMDLQLLKAVVSEFKPQVVVHMAAIAGIDTVIQNPVLTMEVNMIGTYNLLKALEPDMDQIERFIDFSTSEVFGSYAYKVNEKNTTNLAPVGEARWTYQVSKIAAEHLVHSYFKTFGLPAVSIRPFNVYGPGQVGEGAIHAFVKKAIEDEMISIHGDGDQIRSWCYIDDFLEGILLCLTKDEAVGNSFNIGNPKGTITISMLADSIVRIAGSASEIQYVPKHYVDVELRIPSIDKAREILGFSPKVDLKTGLQHTIDWYRSQSV